MASEAIPAASLILVREAERSPPQLLMVERSESMAFAPGALVFPGGRIDPGDLAVAQSAGCGAAYIAAIRETIEECAMPVGINPVPTAEEAAGMQQALLSGAEFCDLLEAGDRWIDAQALTPFARWVPDHPVSRRFDTLFFVAKASGDGRMPQVGSSECVSANWISAAEALRQDREGCSRLIYPTRKILERLAQFADWDAVQADALAHPIVPVTGTLQVIGGEEFLCLPEGLGYPVTHDRLDKVWRG